MKKSELLAICFLSKLFLRDQRSFNGTKKNLKSIFSSVIRIDIRFALSLNLSLASTNIQTFFPNPRIRISTRKGPRNLEHFFFERGSSRCRSYGRCTVPIDRSSMKSPERSSLGSSSRTCRLLLLPFAILLSKKKETKKKKKDLSISDPRAEYNPTSFAWSN